MLNAPTETQAAPRTAPRQPQARDANPSPTGFSSLVDDNASSNTDAPRSRPARNAEAAPPATPARRARENRNPDDPVPPDAYLSSASLPDDPAAMKIGISVIKVDADMPAKGVTSDVPTMDAVAKPAADASVLDPALAVAEAGVPAPAVAANIPIVPVAVTAPLAPATQPTASTPGNAAGPLTIAAAGLAAAKAVSPPKTVAAPSSETSVPDTTPESSADAGEVIPTSYVGEKPKTVTVAAETVAIKTETGFVKPADPKPSATETTGATAPVAVKTAQKAGAAPAAPESKEAVSAEDIAPAPASPSQPHDHRAAAAPPASIDAAPTGPQPVTPQPASHAVAAVSPTAQLTATVASASPVPLNGLAVELAVRAQSGASRFEIRLDPADLGRIDVRIDIDRQGQVTSHLTVEKPETLAMLRQDSPQLQRALNDAGLKTADGALQFTLGDQSQPRQNTDTAERQAQRFIIRDDETVALPPPVRGYGRMFAARGGVDISV